MAGRLRRQKRSVDGIEKESVESFKDKVHGDAVLRRRGAPPKSCDKICFGAGKRESPGMFSSGRCGAHSKCYNYV